MPHAPAWFKTSFAKHAGQYGICWSGFGMRTQNLYTFNRRKHIDAFVSYGASVFGLIADSHSSFWMSSSLVVTKIGAEPRYVA